MIRVTAGVVEKLSTSGGRKTFFSRAFELPTRSKSTPLCQDALVAAVAVVGQFDFHRALSNRQIAPLESAIEFRSRRMLTRLTSKQSKMLSGRTSTMRNCRNFTEQ
jgi:hypothetical protein